MRTAKSQSLERAADETAEKDGDRMTRDGRRKIRARGNAEGVEGGAQEGQPGIDVAKSHGDVRKVRAFSVQFENAAGYFVGLAIGCPRGACDREGLWTARACSWQEVIARAELHGEAVGVTKVTGPSVRVRVTSLAAAMARRKSLSSGLKRRKPSIQIFWNRRLEAKAWRMTWPRVAKPRAAIAASTSFQTRWKALPSGESLRSFERRSGSAACIFEAGDGLDNDIGHAGCFGDLGELRELQAVAECGAGEG